MSLLLFQVAGEKTTEIAGSLDKTPLATMLALMCAAMVALFGVALVFIRQSRVDLKGSRDAERTASASVVAAIGEKLVMEKAHSEEKAKLAAQSYNDLRTLSLALNVLATEYKLQSEGLGGLIGECVRVLKVVGNRDPRVREVLRKAEAVAGDEAAARARDKFAAKEPTVPTPVVPAAEVPGG